MKKTTFHTTILLQGKTATGMRVPPVVVEGLGSHKRPPVRVTIEGHTYRTTVAVMGGDFMIPLSAANRSAAGVSAGDEVDVGIELDTAPREVMVPPDFKKALERDARAKRSFEQLSCSHKQQHVLAIEEAKKPETRERRITKSITMLREDRP